MQQINAGILPIYEEGLEELLKKYAGKSIIATVDNEYAVLNTNISFICIWTPSEEDENINLSIIRSATESIGSALD